MVRRVVLSCPYLLELLDVRFILLRDLLDFLLHGRKSAGVAGIHFLLCFLLFGYCRIERGFKVDQRTQIEWRDWF